ADFGPGGCSPDCRALRPAPKIAVIAPAREMFDPGEPVAAAVRVADAAPGLSVAAELRDPRGRVIERGNFPVDAAKGAAQVSFPPKRLVENCHFIAASLRDGAGRELDRREQPIYRRVGRRSDYTIFCDGFHQGGYNGLHHLATLEYYGIDCCQDGSPGRLWFGGDPVIRDRMAGAYSEMDGSMASPYFLASLQRRFRKDAAAIAKKNGLFISCGDDSGVPTKFSATTPDWAPAYFDILIGRFREAERKNGAKGYRLIEQWCKDRGIKPLASYYGGFIGKLRPRNCLPTLLSAKLFPGDFDDIAAAVRSTYVQPNGVEHFNRQNGVEISSWAELTPELIKSIRPAPSSEFVEFQFWLRDSRYNGDIAKLNAFWKSGFKDFFEIDEEAMVELKNRRHFGAEIDRRAYFEHLLTGEIAALRRGVDSVDRRIQSFMGCSGYETLVEQGMRGFGSTCPYWLKHRETEMFRFLKQRGGYVGDTLGTYKSPALPRDQREWDVWHSVLTGANMSWFWTPCYALRGDLGVEAGLAGYTLEAYREIKRGPSSLMLRSRRENDGIRILWSSASARMEGIRSENGSSLAIAKVFQECLENAGYQYDYIYECDVEAGALTGGKVRTLILPAARLLPEKTAAAVRAFVEAGGTAVSDFRPADVAPDGSLLEKGLLDDVFAGPGDGPFAVRRIGRGRTTVLNRNPVCFRFAEGTADDTAMNAKLREAVGFDPAIDARWTGGGRVLGSEITRFTRDGAEFVGFEKRPATGEKLPGEATLRFPKKAWTYDVRGGRALGFVDAVALRLKGFDTHFLSRLPYEVKAVRVDAPREVVRGGTLRVAAEVVVSGGRA
ncbi:MAG: hypothetical protein J6T01_02000, partial [Kiritimatiellae bacterium]|nr:hypothetical protein [Kiritimatiellia bacterium]